VEPAFNGAILGLADALCVALRYAGARAGAERSLLVAPAPDFDASEGYDVPFAPAAFLAARPTPVAHAPATPPIAAPAPGVSRGAGAAVVRSGTGAPALVETAAVAMIDRALRGIGDILVFGEPGGGKTSILEHLGLTYYDGVEKVENSSSLHAEDLYGYPIRTEAGTAWEPGPLHRLCARVEAGQRILLILDELPRAHPSMADESMKIMNRVSAATVRGHGLAIPTQPGPYMIVRVAGARRTYVIPDGMVRVAATANLGESYRGMDMSDKAQLDRLTWNLELPPLTDDEVRAILAHHTGLAPAHGLFAAMLAVRREVKAINASALLRTTVTLRTLVSWARNVALFCGPGAPAATVKREFVEVARHTWVRKVAPLEGDGTDPVVVGKILNQIERHAPVCPL